MGSFKIRTDLALEARENLDKSGEELNGIQIQEEEDSQNNIHTTTVTITTENSAKAIGKPVGCYVTMEVPDLGSEDEGYHREISEVLAQRLKVFARTESAQYFWWGSVIGM